MYRFQRILMIVMAFFRQAQYRSGQVEQKNSSGGFFIFRNLLVFYPV
jgi:hypothetical protein